MGPRRYDRGDNTQLGQLRALKTSVTAAASPREPIREVDALSLDGDLVWFFAVVGIASIVRVWGAIVRYETFGTEPTLALLFAVGMPWLLKDALKRLGQRLAGWRIRRESGANGR